MLAFRIHRCCLPLEELRRHSDLGTFRGSIPCLPVLLSTLRVPSSDCHVHDSEPVWLARPSPYGSFIRTSTPVYPGALLPVLALSGVKEYPVENTLKIRSLR